MIVTLCVVDPVPGQTLEELPHSHKIQLVRTVEHHTLNCHSFP